MWYLVIYKKNVRLTIFDLFSCMITLKTFPEATMIVLDTV